MCAKCSLSTDDQVVPVVHPVGGFVPIMCCVCGQLLRKARHVFLEGTICAYCVHDLPAGVRRALALAQAQKEHDESALASSPRYVVRRIRRGR